MSGSWARPDDVAGSAPPDGTAVVPGNSPAPLSPVAPPEIDRTQALLAVWNADVPSAHRAGVDLLRRYAAPERGYHDQLHLAEALAALDVLGGGRLERMAILFHDAVYGLGPGADERASADLARRVLTAAGLEPGDVVEVERLVLLTERHSPAPDDRAGQRVSDADMAILASPPGRYRASVAGIRHEYARFDDAQFDAGRRAVLAGFLAATEIFHTDHGRRHWEQAARHNVAHELHAREAGTWDTDPTPP